MQQHAAIYREHRLRQQQQRENSHGPENNREANRRRYTPPEQKPTPPRTVLQPSRSSSPRSDPNYYARHADYTGRWEDDVSPEPRRRSPAAYPPAPPEPHRRSPVARPPIKSSIGPRTPPTPQKSGNRWNRQASAQANKRWPTSSQRRDTRGQQRREVSRTQLQSYYEDRPGRPHPTDAELEAVKDGEQIRSNGSSTIKKETR
jgi:hypothetical protein